MSDYTYPIVSWNPIVNQSGDTVTSIMFKPDLKALELFNKAPMHTVLVTISNSGMNIDGKLMFAIIDQSGELPPFGSREKLFNGSGLYTLTLPSTWLGYPNQDNQGTVTLQHREMNGIVTELQSVPPKLSKKVVAPVDPKEIATALPSTTEPSTTETFKHFSLLTKMDRQNHLFILVITLLILFLIFYSYYF